eukprot:11171316-Lingulodinium_polyedra.AAC.1
MKQPAARERPLAAYAATLLLTACAPQHRHLVPAHTELGVTWVEQEWTLADVQAQVDQAAAGKLQPAVAAVGVKWWAQTQVAPLLEQLAETVPPPSQTGIAR